MNTRQAIQWFKTNFHQQTRDALGGTPFTVDMVAAIAYQETGYIWAPLINSMSVPEILAVCVGDIIDAPGRDAFPKTKAALLAEPDGARMFKVAREAFEAVAKVNAGYAKYVSMPDKFCHGFGITQYDIQFFETNPAFFLDRKWCDFGACLEVLVAELKSALVRAYGKNKTTLTDEERIYVAIAYNKGSVKVGAGFKQGYKSNDDRYYGEGIADFLQIAQTVPSVVETPSPLPPTLEIVRDTPIAPLPKKQSSPAYPGHLIKRDSSDIDSVKLIQARLRGLGFTEPGPNGPRPLAADGIYGHNTADAIELFQIRYTDIHGAPLEVDGEVGSDTWGALFGSETVHESPAVPDAAILAKVLEVAAGEIGVLEKPPGSNRGPRVQEYQASVGIDPGEPWCVAFVYFCFATAAKALGTKNPMSEKKCRTGSVLTLWNLARANGVPTITREAALDDPSKVKPGMVFIISTGGGNGHTGLVVRVVGNRLETIEGNTNDGGSREGIGVFRRMARTIDKIKIGFIDFA